MSITKEEIAEIFEEIAELLEIKDENIFKIRAYSNASRVISQLPGNIEDIASKGELTEIHGIGRDLASKIEELIKTGHLSYYDELKKSIPVSIFELLKLRGLGPKKAKILYEKLGIKNAGDLKDALENNKLSQLDGFGEKTVSNLFESIKEYNTYKERFLYFKARQEADLIVAYLLNVNEVNRSISNIEIAGSLRRKLETAGDIDILAASQKPQIIGEVFIKYDKIAHIESRGETKVSVMLKNGMRVDLRIVPPEDYIYALHHFTGSKLHNEELRTLEKRHGYKINEYGIYLLNNDSNADGLTENNLNNNNRNENNENKTNLNENKIIVKSEKEFYNVFNMQFIPPELREGTGEIEEALKQNIPELIDIKDIQGIFHVHTTYTDGKESLEGMVEAALKKDFKYIGISDHSVSAHYAGGLSADELNSEIEYIDRLNEQYKGKITILKGIESDILENGNLDYGDSVLSKLDFVIASVHSHFNMSKEEMTGRIIKAIKNPYTTMIGHLTGRLILERKGYEVDVSAVLDVLSKYKTIIELNANPKRLDIDWRYIKEAISKSVMLSINPDAHKKAGLDFIEYGVNAARKGWTTKKNVLNTYCIEDVLIMLKKIREHKLKTI
ncbi:MAG: helix-hairpin-helix domain-containing protein [bacterium]